MFNGADGNSTAMISLPFVRGRYLKKLEAKYANSDTKRFVVQQGGAPNGSPNVWITNSNPTTFSFPNSTIPCIYGQTYGLRMRYGNVELQKVAITYTKTKPE